MEICRSWEDEDRLAAEEGKHSLEGRNGTELKSFTGEEENQSVTLVGVYVVCIVYRVEYWNINSWTLWGSSTLGEDETLEYAQGSPGSVACREARHRVRHEAGKPRSTALPNLVKAHPLELQKTRIIPKSGPGSRDML